MTYALIYTVNEIEKLLLAFLLRFRATFDAFGAAIQFLFQRRARTRFAAFFPQRLLGIF